MDAKDLKDTTMNPLTRKLIRVSIDDDEPGMTGDLVERLMGRSRNCGSSIFKRTRGLWRSWMSNRTDSQ